MPTYKLIYFNFNSMLEPGKLRKYTMRFCPYAQRVHLVLLAKKIPHDIVYINLKEGKGPWYLAKYPAGKVPAIVVNGLVNAYAGKADSLYPKNPRQRAIVDQRLNFDIGTLFPRYSNLYFPMLFRGDEYNQVENADKLNVEAGWLNIFLEKSAFVAGDNPYDWEDIDETGAQMLADFLKIEDEAVGYVSPEPPDHATFIKSHKAGTPNYDGIL
uniref:Glutathione S-transferase n=1 Tax=Apolygus lucorum TaxID=248454 RepID=A0A386IRK1_APOLU|nr:glutathione S-transferase [Apolygus lucorum]